MRLLLIGMAILVTTSAAALEPREGWFVAQSKKSYADLLADLKAAVEAGEMGIVTEAGPTEAAARGV